MRRKDKRLRMISRQRKRRIQNTPRKVKARRRREAFRAPKASAAPR